MKTEYRTIVTNTVKGIKQAERMQNAGWEIVSSRFFSILFRRNVKTKKNYSFDPEILNGLLKICKGK